MRTDNALRDIQTGAWLYVWTLSLLGFYLTVTRCPPRA